VPAQIYLTWNLLLITGIGGVLLVMEMEKTWMLLCFRTKMLDKMAE